MNGQPQLDLDMEKAGDTQFVTSSYLPDPKAKDAKVVKINYNFSPSIAFAGKRFVVASTNALAHSLVTASAANDRRAMPTASSTQMPNCVSIHFETSSRTIVGNLSHKTCSRKVTRRKRRNEMSVYCWNSIGWFDHLGLAVDTTQSELRVALTW